MKALSELQSEYKTCLSTMQHHMETCKNAMETCFQKEVEYKFAYVLQLSTTQGIFIPYGSRRVEEVRPILPIKIVLPSIYSIFTQRLRVEIIRTGEIRDITFNRLCNKHGSWISFP